ncbi:uncharacterized protein YbjT (DUF2867 family) [Promicromonospora sp. AC04]|uniref:SDR family oxidoreductase n=1 Tax=Promicromonospora sp. AC04 TaxID=2135723 RepID=UPI000D384A7F|nr:SDR family oxidoreductase [Promicromonospora sp. AC04]PUB27678.1 uncharacterized protein YbjT (DUF2867 family) [Promicromonospora sp. AC04]
MTDTTSAHTPDPEEAASPLTGPVLVVGATGDLGGKVVDALLANGKQVRALVRPTTNANKLEAHGVEIARGDMLDKASLVKAMTGADAVITTAAGYTRGGKQANDIDTVGNANLAEAAKEAGVRRFVLTSILTSHLTPDVPHFWHKKLAEDKLESLGVPFVALRPGAFLDQITQMNGNNPFEKHSTTWLGSKKVKLTFVLTTDLAKLLAAAVDAPVTDGERIDIGWDRPISMDDFAQISTNITGAKMKVRAIPTGLLLTAGALIGRWAPLVPDMAAMARWFDTGKYVADTSRQAEVLGPVPTAEEAIAGFAAGLRAQR